MYHVPVFDMHGLVWLCNLHPFGVAANIGYDTDVHVDLATLIMKVFQIALNNIMTL